MFESLKKRLLSSFFLLGILILIINLDKIFFKFFLIILFLISIYEMNKLLKNNIFKFLGFFFLILSFYTVYEIKYNNINEYLFIIVLGVSVFTDLGGYIFGNLLKGPKLSKLSPNKTYSGSLGGLILSLIYVYIFSILIFYNDYFLDHFFIICSMSIVSQLGDLTISYFKRLNKLKDTGNLIPGHGGILDRIDGMIFIFPYCYFLTNFNFI